MLSEYLPYRRELFLSVLFSINQSPDISLHGLFLLSVVLGCGLGLLYDIFRVFRTALPHGKILTFFEDIIYTFLYGFALFTFCTGLTGAIRGFVLVFALFHKTVPETVCSFGN